MTAIIILSLIVVKQEILIISILLSDFSWPAMANIQSHVVKKTRDVLADIQITSTVIVD